MRWDRDHRSDDVIDQRGSGGGAPMGAGVGILFWLASRFGLPGLVLGGVILAAGYFLTPSGGSRSAVSPSEGERGAAAQDETAAFVGFVLDDVQSTWQQIFAKAGRRYVPAKLVLFTDSTRSGCGYGSAEVGPFYCPRDQRVYGPTNEIPRQILPAIGAYRHIEAALRRLGDRTAPWSQRPRNAPTRAANSAVSMRTSLPSVTKSKPLATMLRA